MERWLKGLDNCTVFEGHGRFDSPHQVSVNDQLLEAEGVMVRLNAECLTVEPLENRIQVGVACEEGGPTVDGSHHRDRRAVPNVGAVTCASVSVCTEVDNRLRQGTPS